jgi:type I restriction enzyme M protein
MVEDDLVDCIIAMPGQLFYSTGIPVSLWFVNRNKENAKNRNRKGETLFIDARRMGYLVDRVHRELSDGSKKDTDTYHAWKALPAAQPDKPKGKKKQGEADGLGYRDVSGFCKSVRIEEIREHEYILTPGRYVGIEEKEDEENPLRRRCRD